MFWAITGGIVIGAIVLGAAYDLIARRHGSRVSVSATGPLDESIVSLNLTHAEFNHL